MPHLRLRIPAGKVQAVSRKRTNGGGRQTREEVAHAILADIVAGRYAPGDCLPGHTRLRPMFGATLSNTTLNSAVGILRDMGFLKVRRQHSTRVADPLPYRHRYAIAFPRRPDVAHPTTLHPVLLRVALDRQRKTGDCEYVFFSGYDDPREQEAVRRSLSEEVRWHRVAGILFASQIWHAADTPLLREPGIARVCLTDCSAASGMPRMPHGSLEQPRRLSFSVRGLDWMRAQGCRSVAVLRFGAPALDRDERASRSQWRPWHRALAESGLTTRPEWLLTIDGGGYETALLLRGGRRIPDGVIVDDDVLVASVTAGLRAAGLPYPKVIARANFPVVPAAAVPTRFLGHDIEDLFDRCLVALRDPEAQRTCPVLPVPAVFEDEWRRGQN